MKKILFIICLSLMSALILIGCNKKIPSNMNIKVAKNISINYNDSKIKCDIGEFKLAGITPLSNRQYKQYLYNELNNAKELWIEYDDNEEQEVYIWLKQPTLDNKEEVKLKMLNAQLLDNGMVESCTTDNNKYKDMFIELTKNAKENKIGLWGSYPKGTKLGDLYYKQVVITEIINENTLITNDNEEIQLYEISSLIKDSDYITKKKINIQENYDKDIIDIKAYLEKNLLNKTVFLEGECNNQYTLWFTKPKDNEESFNIQIINDGYGTTDRWFFNTEWKAISNNIGIWNSVESNKQETNIEQPKSETSKDNTTQQNNNISKDNVVSQDNGNELVYIANTGNCYHTRKNCRGFSRAKNISSIILNDAKKRGLKPCSLCD